MFQNISELPTVNTAGTRVLENCSELPPVHTAGTRVFKNCSELPIKYTADSDPTSLDFVLDVTLQTGPS